MSKHLDYGPLPVLVGREIIDHAASSDSHVSKAVNQHGDFLSSDLELQVLCDDQDAAKDEQRPRINSNEPPAIAVGLVLRRWLQLALLSLLALVSDWACFAFVAVPEEFRKARRHKPEELIDIFLFTNVVSCFCVTDVTRILGLRWVVSLASVLMAAGCLLRSGMPFSTLPDYNTMIAGTICIGAAQPFFQCTPPLLSQTWFANNERALATAIAINFNQIGIACGFVIGGWMQIEGVIDLRTYLTYISIASVVAAGLTIIWFDELPALAPSVSAAIARQQDNDRSQRLAFTYPCTVVSLFRKPGFLHSFVAFVASISVSNAVSAFNATEMARAGVKNANVVNFVGALFQIAIVLGGIIFGSYVGRTKRFKSTTTLLLCGSLLLLMLLGIAEGVDDHLSSPWVIFGMLLLGFLLGPVQPINAELGVEVAYPLEENGVEATQQLGGNLFSAILLPICIRGAREDIKFPGFIDAFKTYTHVATDVRGDSAMLLIVVTLAIAYFATFNAPLLREQADHEKVDTVKIGAEAPGQSSDEQMQECAKEDTHDVGLDGADDRGAQAEQAL